MNRITGQEQMEKPRILLGAAGGIFPRQRIPEIEFAEFENTYNEII